MKKPRRQGTLALVLPTLTLAFSLLLSAPTLAFASQATPTYTYQGPGWVTAEDAAKVYLDAFAQADLRGMVSTFAIETYVERFDFGAQLERMNAYVPQAEIPYPNANDFFEAMNVENRHNTIVKSIHFQFFSLYFPQMDSAMVTSFGSNDADRQAFEDQMGGVTDAAPGAFAFYGFVDPALLSEVYMQDKNQEHLAKLAAIYGAEELKSVAASISIKGRPRLLCWDALRYGDKWYLSSLGGNIGIILGLDMYRGGLSPAP